MGVSSSVPETVRGLPEALERWGLVRLSPKLSETVSETRTMGVSLEKKAKKAGQTNMTLKRHDP
jgi:hypothetical protein